MKRALETVNDKILNAVKERPANVRVFATAPRLVAVSKFKPISAIVEAYECGQRFFGENYIQELEEKSNSPEIIDKCPEIKFHFIGHLQSNKVNKLLQVRNLNMIETIDSVKLANLINTSIAKHKSGVSSEDKQSVKNHESLFLTEKLKVMIQVNTSDEDQKHGIKPEEAPSLAEHIKSSCNFLEFVGLMTIGSLEASSGNSENQDFIKLYNLRQLVARQLGVEPKSLELSMGMSSDFEEAIKMGSSNVRIGSIIFGEREKPT